MASEPPVGNPDDPGHPVASPPGPPPPPELEPWSPSVPPGGPESQRFGEIAALLQNRFILAALAAVVVLLLITIVLVALGNDDDNSAPSLIDQGTPVSGSTVVPLEGLPGRLSASVSMHNGPGPTYAILGTIPRNALVSVVGRNEDNSWLQVVYPPGSQLRGWIDATLVDVEGNISQLAIGGPGVGPNIDVPTSTGFETPLEIPTEPLEVPTVPEEEATPTEPDEPGRPTSTPRRPTTTPIFVPTSTPPAPTVGP